MGRQYLRLDRIWTLTAQKGHPKHDWVTNDSLSFVVQVNGKSGPGRPKMTWKQLTERDRREWKLSAIDPHDRDTWRSGVRSAMRAASQLSGRGPHCCGYHHHHHHHRIFD